jgi:hypothetical protein
MKELPADQGWPVEITCQRGDLAATLGGVAFNPIRLTVAPTSLSLTVTKGTVAMRKLAIATAK